MQRNFKKKNVIKLLGEIALGRSNDVVKLAFMNPDENGCGIDELDLKMLSEIRRSTNGSVELKLLNRLEALKTMLEAVDGEPGEEATAFLSALSGGSEVKRQNENQDHLT